MIVRNSNLYNGDKSKITASAKKMVSEIQNIIDNVVKIKEDSNKTGGGGKI